MRSRTSCRQQQSQPQARRASGLLVLAATLACCGTSDEVIKTPRDLKERFPALAALVFAVPGRAGPARSASEAVFQQVAAGQAALAALGLLQQYYDKGGAQNKDVSITLALEGAPRVADQTVRYSREASRLDVERVGDHALFYLQYDWGNGFDPDNAVGEKRLVLEGSTVVPETLGRRAAIDRAKGLADATRGYLRSQFNHRPEDTDAAHTAAQLDYELRSDLTSLHLTFFVRPDSTQVDPLIGLWLRQRADGSGQLYASQLRGGAASYRLLAQFAADGALAVWSGDGQIWGCYDATGAELGNAKTPAPCASFKDKFVTPPKGPGVFADLPATVPK